MTLQVLGLTIDQVDAAAVAAGALRVIGWPTTWRRRFEQLGLSFDGLVTHPVLIHGCLGVSDAQRRRAAELGVALRAGGCVAARAVFAAFVRRVDGGHRVLGHQPRWASSLADVVSCWPAGVDLVAVLDDVDAVEPAAEMGSLSGPWRAHPDLVRRLIAVDPNAYRIEVPPKPAPPPVAAVRGASSSAGQRPDQAFVEALRRELRAAGASAAWRFVEVLRKGPLPGGMDDPIPVECFRWELVHPGQPPIAIVPGCSAASVAQQAAERPAGGPRS